MQVCSTCKGVHHQADRAKSKHAEEEKGRPVNCTFRGRGIDARHLRQPSHNADHENQTERQRSRDQLEFH
jgi:hypothetical protein